MLNGMNRLALFATIAFSCSAMNSARCEEKPAPSKQASPPSRDVPNNTSQSHHSETEPLSFPLLNCTVKFADGYFDAYSAPPSPGDTAQLDFNSFLQTRADNDNKSFDFKATRRRLNMSPLSILKTASLSSTSKRWTPTTTALQRLRSCTRS
jgi:hypothetical protein